VGCQVKAVVARAESFTVICEVKHESVARASLKLPTHRSISKPVTGCSFDADDEGREREGLLGGGRGEGCSWEAA
jgi:hypothetical protein